ncbi:MAG: peptidoglycan-binding domain-containing protein [Planktothrix sp.]|uniref:peptidoglycan-binding domain-containing protein n=1 Tax=Planktothrix sp. TaxID=3088171 RepID=UPI0038D4A45E
MSNTNLENDKTSQTGILKLGSQGEQVKYLQKSLATLKYFKIEENEEYEKGYFGLQTENAVKQFQEDKSLEVNGTLDAQTIEALPRAKKNDGDYSVTSGQNGDNTIVSKENSDELQPKPGNETQDNSQNKDDNKTKEDAKK